MSPLSNTLLAVLDGLPSAVPSFSPSSLIESYRQSVSANSDALDGITSTTEVTPLSLDVRAAKATKANQILFGERSITPQSQLYTRELQKNWSSTCWLPAASFLKLENTVEVALALTIVTIFKTTFAIRSGGHSASPGFASIDGAGIVLDLGGLNEIALSPALDVASVGPGATWDKVYETLEQKSLTVVGGRVSGVGVGGLITGGGMSHFSNHWGLACDNVKNFEVVLADSTIVQANTNENPDIFRALKGGGANFGIVTRFDLYTNPDYQVWYTFKVFSAAESERIMKAAVEVQSAMDEDDHIGFFLSVHAGILVAGMLWRGETPPKTAFSAFDGIEPLQIAVPETKGTQASVTQAASMAGGGKREFGAVSIRTDAVLYAELHKILQGVVAGNEKTSISLSFTFQPLGAAAARKGQESGGNAVNIPPESQSWLGVISQWTNDEDDDLARSQIRQLISLIESAAEARGLLIGFRFMNDASQLQSPFQKYSTESLDFLTRVSQKWDPEDVFQNLQNAGFLLPKGATV